MTEAEEKKTRYIYKCIITQYLHLALLHPTQCPRSITDRQMLHVSATLVLIGSVWEDFSGSLIPFPTH